MLGPPGPKCSPNRWADALDLGAHRRNHVVGQVSYDRGVRATTARAANQSWSVFIRLFSDLGGVFMASAKVGFTCVKVAFRPLIVWLGRGYFNVCIDSVYSAV